MPCAWATSITSRTKRYLVVLSPRTLICGCGVFCASTESRLSSSPASMGSSFQYNEPSASIARVIGGTSGAISSFRSRLASGRSTWILCDINGAVIMKMIRSTSITSTSGVTLMSAIGPPLLLPELKAISELRLNLLDGRLLRLADFADARAGGEEVVQVVGEGVHLVVRHPVGAGEEVERQHRRDGDEQTERGHDQRLA